jgi:hypothetical protein
MVSSGRSNKTLGVDVLGDAALARPFREAEQINVPFVGLSINPF